MPADPVVSHVQTGPEHLLRDAGIEVVVLNDKDAISLSNDRVLDALE